MDRGSCSFAEKALNAQKAGAIGIIVANNVVTEAAFAMGFDQQHDSVQILAMMVSNDVGNALRQLNVRHGTGKTALFMSVELAAKAQTAAGTVGQIAMEQHVYVPEATQSWLQTHTKLDILETKETGSLTWQAMLINLAASMQPVQDLDQLLEDP